MDRHPHDLKAQKRQQAELERQQKAAQVVRESTLKTQMETRPGRAFVCRLLTDLNVYSDTFNATHSLMAGEAAKQKLGHQLRQELERLCPELWLQMERERLEDNADGGRDPNTN